MVPAFIIKLIWQDINMQVYIVLHLLAWISIWNVFVEFWASNITSILTEASITFNSKKASKSCVTRYFNCESSAFETRSKKCGLQIFPSAPGRANKVRQSLTFKLALFLEARGRLPSKRSGFNRLCKIVTRRSVSPIEVPYKPNYLAIAIRFILSKSSNGIDFCPAGFFFLPFFYFIFS